MSALMPLTRLVFRRGRSRVRAAASSLSQLRLHGVIDVSVDFVVTYAAAQAVPL
jgi:hypothetical protein